jgi:hypothetical protein
MMPENIADILIESLMPVIESKLPKPMATATAALTDEKYDPVTALQKLIGDRKIMVMAGIFSSEYDASFAINEVYGKHVILEEQLIVQRNPAKALELLAASPKDFVAVISDDPGLLTRIRGDGRLAHITRVYQSHGRYIDDVLEGDYDKMGVHGVVAEHSYQEEGTLVNTLLDAIATRQKGETITGKISRSRYM